MFLRAAARCFAVVMFPLGGRHAVDTLPGIAKLCAGSPPVYTRVGAGTSGCLSGSAGDRVRATAVRLEATRISAASLGAGTAPRRRERRGPQAERVPPTPLRSRRPPT